MEGNTVALATIALAGTIATGFFALLTRLGKSIDAMTASNHTIAKEAEGRNAHLAKLVIETARYSDKQAVLNQRAIEDYHKSNKEEK